MFPLLLHLHHNSSAKKVKFSKTSKCPKSKSPFCFINEFVFYWNTKIEIPWNIFETICIVNQTFTKLNILKRFKNHKSEIAADLNDLDKFSDTGELKPRVSVYNKKLKLDIDTEIDAMETAYKQLCAQKDKPWITHVMLYPRKMRC